MSAFDRRPSFYQYYDITDPTPYEDCEETELEDADCCLCGGGFHRREQVLRLVRAGEETVMHSACFRTVFPNGKTRDKVLDFL